MVVWLDRLGEILLDASLSATALLSLVALAMIGCQQPVRRVWLARASILGALALLPLVILAPLPRVALNQVAARSGLLVHPIFSPLTHQHSPDAVPPSAKVNDKHASSAGLRPHRRLVGPPPRWLVIAYLAGSGASMAWLLLGYWGLSWLTSQASEASPAAADLYRKSFFASRRRPRLLVSERVRRPVLVGLFRQSILIPVELDLPESADRLHLSLLHELAHTERSDSWFGLASGLSQAAWFYLPPLWWIRSQMRLDQEFLADRRAARAFGPLQAYAAGLVEIAGGLSNPVPAVATTARRRLDETSALFQRVLMLVQCPFTVETHPPRWWACLLPGLVVLGTLAASCLTFGGAETSPPRRMTPTPSTPAQKSFQVSRLVVNRGNASTSRPWIYTLPLSTPPSFELTLEVWGNSNSLAQTKVFGLRLLDGLPEDGPQTAEDPLSWHKVQLRRGPGQISLKVDHIAYLIDPVPERARPITIELPADSSVYLRNLRLTW